MRQKVAIGGVSATRKPSAVLIGLDSMQGLQVARILAARGVPLVGISGTQSHYGWHTRVCERKMVADTGGPKLIEALEGLSEELDPPIVLIPCQDKNVLLISRFRDRLTAAGYVVRLPDNATVERLYDKAAFADYASSVGLLVPASRRVESQGDLEAAAHEIPFPVVVKPPRRSGAWSKNTKAKAIRVDSAAELKQVYAQVGPWAPYLVVQQWIDGPESDLFSFNGYYDENSKLLVSFIARKLRQYPPHIGQSSYGVEADAPEVFENSHRFFENSGIIGFAYLEMKRDSRTGQFYAVEPNIGRPTGRSPIAEAGGVALHYTAYCDAAGLPLPSERTQMFGSARWIHLLRDTQTSILYMRSGELTLREWIRSLKGKKAYAVLSLRDPLPFIAALVQGARDLLGFGEKRRHTI